MKFNFNSKVEIITIINQLKHRNLIVQNTVLEINTNNDVYLIDTYGEAVAKFSNIKQMVGGSIIPHGVQNH